jgi:small GTP-binding protein
MEEVLKKVVLLGDSGVGKTSLINRFVYNRFSDSYISTVGAKVSKKTVEVHLGDEKYSVSMMVWDIIGSTGFESTQSRHIAGLNGAIVITDLSRPDTLANLEKYWLPLLSKVTANVLPPILFAGNKVDIVDTKQASQTMKSFSEMDKKLRSAQTIGRYKVLNPYFVTSAKTGQGVEEGFRTLAIMMMMEHYTFEPLARQMDEVIAETIYAEDERKTPRSIMDMILADFPFVVQSSDISTTILQDCFSRFKVSKDNPSVDGIKEIIDCALRLALDKGAKDKTVEKYRGKWLEALANIK